MKTEAVFSQFNLEPNLHENLEKLGWNNCTEIQQHAIPLIHEGKDVAGLAQTGTGKTGAYLVPLIDRILKAQKLKTLPADSEASVELQKFAFHDWLPRNCILVLVPTRELAEQVTEAVRGLSGEKLNSVAIYGGTSYQPQVAALKAGVEFIVATPGRLKDLYQDNLVDLKQVRAVVFDEADRLFDLGFRQDMAYLLQRIPTNRQYLVFTATMSPDVFQMSYRFEAHLHEINVSLDKAKADNVKDEIFHLSQDEKPKYLFSLLKRYEPKQVIIFTNFKNRVEAIAHFLNQNEIPALGISSLLSQAQRNRVLEQFKTVNEKNILVATDVAARGLDVQGVDLVVNFDLPMDAESYVHRIGRTGRAGQLGKAFSLVSDQDVESLQRIETYLKNKLEMGWLDDKDILNPVAGMDWSWDGQKPHRSSDTRSPRGHGPQRRPHSGDKNQRDGHRDNKNKSNNRPHGASAAPNQRSDQTRNEKRSEHRSDNRKAHPHHKKQNQHQHPKNGSVQSKQPRMDQPNKGSRVAVRMKDSGQKKSPLPSNASLVARVASKVKSWFGR